MIVHVGRKSGKTYHTPVNLFRTDDGGYLIALTYGRDSDWVRNVIAHDGCEALIRNRPVRLTRPRVVHDPRRRAVPAPARLFLGLVGSSWAWSASRTSWNCTPIPPDRHDGMLHRSGLSPRVTGRARAGRS